MARKRRKGTRRKGGRRKGKKKKRRAGFVYELEGHRTGVIRQKKTGRIFGRWS